jgi:hypothetical protein
MYVPAAFSLLCLSHTVRNVCDTGMRTCAKGDTIRMRLAFSAVCRVLCYYMYCPPDTVLSVHATHLEQLI